MCLWFGDLWYYWMSCIFKVWVDYVERTLKSWMLYSIRTWNWSTDMGWISTRQCSITRVWMAIRLWSYQSIQVKWIKNIFLNHHKFNPNKVKLTTKLSTRSIYNPTRQKKFLLNCCTLYRSRTIKRLNSSIEVTIHYELYKNNKT